MDSYKRNLPKRPRELTLRVGLVGEYSHIIVFRIMLLV